jgi:CMP-N,N'-diacetyllegionaminic acid synthase
MRTVAVIPARGGSKGIKKKNLREIGKHSLVEIKVLQALNSKISEVYVSTDDEEIAKVASRAGANVLHRSDDLASDTASTDAVLLDVTNQLSLSGSDVIVLLQATSPLMKACRINQCLTQLLDNLELNSVITIKNGHPFMWKKSKIGFEPDGHSRDYRPRRQELTEAGWETGACYAIRADALLEQKVRYPFPTGVIETQFYESLDIDNMDDLNVARALASLIDLG